MQKYKVLIDIYNDIKSEIENRISQFRDIWANMDEEFLFGELVFCLMTPQSKAKSASLALQILKSTNLLFKGSASEIADKINLVRFKNNKARYIVKCRTQFCIDGKINIRNFLTQKTAYDMREYLVKNVTGIGYKEASHFLRNIGLSENLAILDRHIIKNMRLFNVLDERFDSVTPKNYKEIEKIFLRFSKELRIPPNHLDFVLWYKEAGEVFK